MYKLGNIILTGATGGVGTEICKILYDNGANLLITSKNEEKLKTLTKKVKEKGGIGRISHLALDLKELDNIDKFVEKSIHLLDGRLDVIINNAGLAYHCDVNNIIRSELEETFNINALGPIYLTSCLLRFLYKSEKGKIINISSFLGSKGMKNTATYTASKHALNGFSKVLRLELANKGIPVTLIEPGAIETDFILRTHDNKTKKIFQQRKIKKLSPEVIADIVYNLLRYDNTICPEIIRITPTGQAI